MIYKRGEVYWYKFMWQGKLVRESTKQGNDKMARQMEAAHLPHISRHNDRNNESSGDCNPLLAN